MSRFSTFCWFAAVLCLFSVGQSQWLPSGGLGMGRASAGEMEDIGQDEPHIGLNQGSGGSIDANQTGGISGETVNTSGSGTINVGSTGSGGVSGISFSSGLSFNVEVIDIGGVWADAFGSTDGFIDTGGSVSGADYTTWANNFGVDLISLTLPAAVSGVSVMMDAAAYTDWANNYGQSGDGVPGDFNGDGVVDMLDNLEWGDHFGEFFSPPLAAAAVAARGASLTAMSVPEPSGLLLLVMGLSSLILWRARRLLPFGMHSTPE